MCRCERGIVVTWWLITFRAANSPTFLPTPPPTCSFCSRWQLANEVVKRLAKSFCVLRTHRSNMHIKMAKLGLVSSRISQMAAGCPWLLACGPWPFCYFSQKLFMQLPVGNVHEDIAYIYVCGGCAELHKSALPSHVTRRYITCTPLTPYTPKHTEQDCFATFMDAAAALEKCHLSTFAGSA